jgi:hypothetical protein
MVLGGFTGRILPAGSVEIGEADRTCTSARDDRSSAVRANDVPGLTGAALLPERRCQLALGEQPVCEIASRGTLFVELIRSGRDLLMRG